MWPIKTSNCVSYIRDCNQFQTSHAHTHIHTPFLCAELHSWQREREREGGGGGGEREGDTS